MKAEQQDLVGKRANPALGCFNERQPKIPRRVLDAIEVAGQPAVRRQHHDAGGVGVLAALRIEHVPESHCTGERFDRLLIACQEMPGIRGARPPISLDVRLLFHRSDRCDVVWIDAHGEDTEVLSERKGNRSYGPKHVVQYKRA